MSLPLACPLCTRTLRAEDDRLACPCGRWPVVDGIPVLHPWALNRSFRPEDLLARFRPPAATFLQKIARRLFPGAARLRAAIGRPGATFLELAAELGRTSDLDYFRYRFSELSYVCSAALLRAVERGPVLDLGCGAGHFERVLARRVGADRIAALDASYPLVWLARRFMEPGASYVCADGGGRLPFPDGAFDAAVCIESFNYLPDRAGTARELLRVARGPVLVAHLSDPAFGGGGIMPPLPPDQYRAMFADRSPQVYPERDILRSFLERGVLDLSRPGASPDGVLTLTAGVTPQVYPGADYFVSGSRLNPLYEVREEGAMLRLRRRSLSPRHDDAHRAFPEWLPAELTVTRAQIEARDPELVRKFILLDLPDRYA